MSTVRSIRGIGHNRKAVQFFRQTNGNGNGLSYGGILRNKRRGRKQRPLSTKEPIHLVLKLNKRMLRSRSLRTYKNFALTSKLINKYAKYFYVKVEQISIQNDHIHCLVRAPRRCQYHHFFRVVAGQIAQQFKKEDRLILVTDTPPVTDTPKTPSNTQARTKTTAKNKKRKGLRLWLYRPFSRVVRGYKAYQIVRNYIQLNEKEALGEIPYQKNRLRGLSSSDWEILWA